MSDSETRDALTVNRKQKREIEEERLKLESKLRLLETEYKILEEKEREVHLERQLRSLVEEEEAVWQKGSSSNSNNTTPTKSIDGGYSTSNSDYGMLPDLVQEINKTKNNPNNSNGNNNNKQQQLQQQSTSYGSSNSTGSPNNISKSSSNSPKNSPKTAIKNGSPSNGQKVEKREEYFDFAGLTRLNGGNININKSTVAR